MRMLVLGAGLQGSACAYDLLQNPAVAEVRLADLHIDHLPDFLAPYSGKRLIPTRLDVRDREAVLAVMRESDAVMSAIPYYFNFELARLAVEAGAHFCDLGGNTEIVFQQRELDAIEGNLGFLASVGSVSPYVGLFGTGWGIMHAFVGLSNLTQVTLATVAPGIAEALVATAIGLFAAIPAVVAYNRFARDIDRIATQLDSFSEEFSNILQRNVSGPQAAAGAR